MTIIYTTSLGIVPIYIGVIGIVLASDTNACLDENNSTVECRNPDLIQPAINSNRMIREDPDADVFLYWLAGATGCGVLFAVIATFSLWALEDALRRIRK